MEDIYESEHTLLQYIFKIYKSTIREAAPGIDQLRRPYSFSHKYARMAEDSSREVVEELKFFN